MRESNKKEGVLTFTGNHLNKRKGEAGLALLDLNKEYINRRKLACVRGRGWGLQFNTQCNLVWTFVIHLNLTIYRSGNIRFLSVWNWFQIFWIFQIFFCWRGRGCSVYISSPTILIDLELHIINVCSFLREYKKDRTEEWIKDSKNWTWSESWMQIPKLNSDWHIFFFFLSEFQTVSMQFSHHLFLQSALTFIFSYTFLLYMCSNFNYLYFPLFSINQDFVGLP